MLNIGDRIKIISSSKSAKIGATCYVVRASFQPTMRCLLLEVVFVAKKPEHKFIVVDLGLAKCLRHQLINGKNIFQVLPSLSNNDRRATFLMLTTLNSLLINVSVPLVSITKRYFPIASHNKLKFPITYIHKEAIDLFSAPYQEYRAWLVANIIGLNDVLEHIPKLMYYNNEACNNDLVVLAKKYLCNKLANITVTSSLGKIKLQLHADDNKTLINRSTEVSIIQQFKATIYRVFIELLRYKLADVRAMLGLTDDAPVNLIRNEVVNKLTIKNIFDCISNLRKCSLNYSKYCNEFDANYFRGSLYKYINMLVISLYSTILPDDERIKLLMSLKPKTLTEQTMSRREIIGFMYRFSHKRRFDRAALASFYRLE